MWLQLPVVGAVFARSDRCRCTSVGGDLDVGWGEGSGSAKEAAGEGMH